MKWRINIGARIGNHFYFTDLKCGSLGIMLFGILPAQVITDLRPGQALVRDHTILNDMAEINAFWHIAFLVV
jgi:hypothetical protein